MILSGGADKYIKLWDIRNLAEPLHSLKVEAPLEDLIEIEDNRFAFAFGNTISLMDLDNSQRLNVVNEVVPFQKNVMQICYDPFRKRLIAGGLDN